MFISTSHYVKNSFVFFGNTLNLIQLFCSLLLVDLFWGMLFVIYVEGKGQNGDWKFYI